MEQIIAAVTLGVADLAGSRNFYRALGWAPVFENDEVVFFQMNGLVLSLWRREAMTAETGRTPGAGPHPFTLAHNVRTRGEVDPALARAQAAGAETQAAEDRAWGGYSGYFTDPDGFLWEVCWNPDWPIAADGRVTIG